MSVPNLHPEFHAEKHKAALSSVLWSAFLTVIKLAAGFSSNSLGLLSEALHSALDFVAATITFFAVRLAAQPADAKHPFGHGKIENLSALAETVLLVITCGWIVFEAVERLFFNAKPVEPSWWAFGVIILSLVVDINRAAMLRRVAKKTRSQALEADALHFTTDIWSSAVVLVGLGSVVVAGHVEAGLLQSILYKGDAMAALGVAFIVLGVSWNLAKRAVVALMDGGLEKESQLLDAALRLEAPAYPVKQLRVRESGAQYFVVLCVYVPATLRVDAAHEVTGMLEETVCRVLPGADVTVHLEPAPDGHNKYATAYQLAEAHDLNIHGLALVELEDGLHLFVHIELPPSMELHAAHAKVSAYEAEVARRVGAVHVVSHLEPQRHAQFAAQAPPNKEETLRLVRACMAQNTTLTQCYDEDVWTVAGAHGLSLRCISASAQTVLQAHEQARALEKELRKFLPQTNRMIIHVEPLSPDTDINPNSQIAFFHSSR